MVYVVFEQGTYLFVAVVRAYYYEFLAGFGVACLPVFSKEQWVYIVYAELEQPYCEL